MFGCKCPSFRRKPESREYSQNMIYPDLLRSYDFFTKLHHELTKEEQKIKEIMVYFLYLIKNKDVSGV